MFRIFLRVISTIFLSTIVLTQTTGKISGKVADAKSGEPLIGANVMLSGTSIGTAADIDGNFFIINILSFYLRNKNHAN